MDLRSLTAAIQAQAIPSKKEWWENYVKDSAPFFGTPMAKVRKATHAWSQGNSIPDLSDPVAVALDLIRLRHTEEKLAGIIMLQEILIPAGKIRASRDVPRFAALFDEGHLYDWNAVDWFCIKVLGELIQRAGLPAARKIAVWRKAENLWRARAASVAFAGLARHGDENFPGFSDLLLSVCGSTVRRSERFAQTAVGWPLRELSHAEPQLVEEFVERHSVELSTEAFNAAVAKLKPPVRTRLKKVRKERLVSRRG